MKQRLSAIQQTILKQRGQLELYQSQAQRLKTELANTDVTLQLEQETLRLLQLASAATWDATKKLVEELVTRALQSVFYDKSYKFVLKQETKRGTASVSFVVEDQGMELDLVDELGGGIVDVVALVLRIAFVLLYRPKTRPVLFLDEPLKHLWSGYQPYAAKFLKQVCGETGLQLLIVTHQNELASYADQVFQISKDGSSCRVVEEKG